MNGTNQVPSTSSRQNKTGLDRNPTWAKFDFDDGFDLKLDSPSAFPSLAEPKTGQPSPAGLASSSQASSQADIQSPAFKDASSLPTAVGSVPPTQQASHEKRSSASSTGSNKDLPRLPGREVLAKGNGFAPGLASSLDQSSSPSGLPTSHSANTVQPNTPTASVQRTTPRTPQHGFVSPIVTAPTPEQKQRSDSDSVLTLRTAAQQTPRSQSTGVPSWDRTTAPVSRPISSADAYQQPVEVLQTEAWSSRPGTAMSHLSGSNWMHDGAGNRSSYGTTTSNALNQAKRASVLSFQTAVSGGFMSGDEGRFSDRGEDFEEAQETLARPAPISKPWLDSYYSGYGSSPDDRTVPGALPNGFWGESSGTSVSSTPQPTQTGVPRQVSDPASVAPVSLPSNGAVPTAIVGADADTGPSKIQILPQEHEDATLAPIQTKELLQSPKAALSPPLSSTTVAAISDDADTQVGPPIAPANFENRTQDAIPAVEEVQHVAFEPAPKPIAKDQVQIVEPPLPPKQEEKIDEGTSDLLAEDVIPPPLPVEAANIQNTVQPQMFMLGPADHKPVSDYRQKPLADISPASKAAGLAQLEAQAGSTRMTTDASGASELSPEAQTPVIPMMERGRRKSTASLTTTAALASATAIAATKVTLADRPDTPSNESPSREASPPPDGEVEARAEWERRQMKRKAKKEQPESKASKGRSDTFRGQLKPLQLVPAENFTSLTTDRRSAQASTTTTNGSRAPVDRHSVAVADRDRSLSGIDSANPDSTMNQSSGANFSTQQLQKLQAREQRRSVGAFSAAMAAANVASSGSNGPYPVFASPGSGPQKVGLRQYPGLMAQRSLVPPFELQHRPDGLPSGLIGPDGVRRSLNDPEVCLECMMRDEDMIDVRVLGEGIWERESDRDFEEALRLEAEEDAKINGLDRSSESAGQGAGSTTSHRDSRSVRRPFKRIGKGDPLTVDRLKLHTQMNPPASSFRWRTLQTFLAVQAKYIAMEQQRMRAGADKKRLSAAPVHRNFPNDSAIAAEAERLSPVPIPPVRDASALPRSYPSTKDALVAEDEGLTKAQREEKQRDVAAAQAARKKMALASPTMAPLPSLPSYPSPSLQARSSQPALLPPQEEESLVTPSTGAGNQSMATNRRVLPALVTAGRVESVPDLRSAAESRASSAMYPSSPAESLIPPTRSFVAPSPTTPSRYANRSGTSQLSMMHSGSMIDMHVAQEDRAEHRLNQNGFIPGTPIAVESPGAMNRPYYGFPGDGDSSLPDAAAFERSRLASGDGYVNPQEAGPTGLDLDRQDSEKQRRKGFRGLFSKLTGGSLGPSRENSQDQSMGAGSAEVASRNPSKRSQASTSPRLRKSSISADRALDTSSSANTNTLGGVISKARKSTSSLFSPKNGLDVETDSRMRSQTGGASLFQSPPGMASQSSLELGPFQPASPTGNAGYVRTKPGPQSASLPADAGRMRKASNPLMQKYLNSPSPRTQAAPGFSSSYQARGDNTEDRPTMITTQFSTDSRNGRISSFASMKDLRTQSLQPILDTQRESISSSTDLKSPVLAPTSGTERGEGTGQTNAARMSQASLRKELPPMPTGVNGTMSAANAAGHQRNDSSGTSAVRSSMVDSLSSSQLSPGLSAVPAAGRIAPIDMGGRRSMQISRPSGQGGSQFTAPSMAFSSSDAPFALTPDDASIGSNGPRRPPKNPRRPDGSLNSASVIDLSEANTNPNALRDFPRPPTQDEDSFNPIMNPPESKEKSGKSKFLRFAFGRKKRESTLADSSHPTIIIGDGIENRPEPAEVGGTLPRLRGRKSYSGLGVPKSSFQTERQRVLSSPAGEVRDLPPRSQSAFGMLSTQRFVSMDARRSMNVSRNSRLSVMQDEEEEDDEMEREPGYEAEFDRYDQEAMQARYQGGSARGRDVSGGAASFGRKSLNLLREGFRMPLRQPSNEQSKKKRFGF